MAKTNYYACDYTLPLKTGDWVQEEMHFGLEGLFQVARKGGRLVLTTHTGHEDDLYDLTLGPDPSPERVSRSVSLISHFEDPQGRVLRYYRFVKSGDVKELVKAARNKAKWCFDQVNNK
ncbi:MAG: hypothetical protein AABX10_04155 [Nanoarchaeota archaeon]